MPGFATSRARPGARIVAGAVLLAIVVAGVVLARYHPESLTLMPTCPSKLLGLECPGCGSTRASHHLLNGRLNEAWRHNPAMIVAGLPFLAILLVDLVSTIVAGRRVLVVFGRGFGIALAVALVVYMIARNLPGERFDSLRPPPVSSSTGCRGLGAAKAACVGRPWHAALPCGARPRHPDLVARVSQ
ncbi:MAG: DUF2752 domain-containing protein [Planctomycetes bacterium]|nr:DUF2752 domain-containing protein [Planctomycetota bacterium]